MAGERRAFVTGISGQDGSYLADLLLERGYAVCGLLRRKADATNWRIRHLYGHPRFSLMSGDVNDFPSLFAVLRDWRPQEVYNLAAQSFVPFSWQAPVSTAQTTALGVLNVLEAIRNIDPTIRLYQASSSEMFGQVREVPQTETTPFHPRSPYGVSKCFGHWITVNYRESYNLFACSGILFNHESERRGIEFVTRKVTYAAARIKHRMQDTLELGNLEAARDWGYAPDYVLAMHAMVMADAPGDFVIATGKQSTVQQLCEAAFSALDLDWKTHVVQSDALLRPAEVNTLLGDPALAGATLGWSAQTTFQQMIERMVEADLKRVSAGIDWQT
jgi:GDPmannose 4,6-dehydratase